MSFHNILKNLRRKNDMTQEELAEILGLTTQAVSRWENDATIPDITTVRRLAYLFDVSTDYLLEVDIASMDDKVDEIITKANTMAPEEAAELLRDALEDFPRNPKLMSTLVYRLYYHIYPHVMENQHDSMQAKAILEEAIRLTEYLYRRDNSHLYNLLAMYRDAGQIEKGKELLNTLSDYGMVRQEMEIQLATGEERIRLMQENAYILLTKLNWQVYELSLESETFTPEERCAMLEQMFAASRALMPEDEPFFYNTQPTHVPWQLARYYSLAGKTDEAIHWLKIMRDAAVKDESFKGERKFRLRSPAFKGLERNRHAHSWGVDWMLDVMGDDYYDNIRNDPRFIEIQDELRKALK